MLRHLRQSSVKIPFRKRWKEEDVVAALRSTVPRPTIAIPWAQGMQHDQTLDFTEVPWITIEDRSSVLMRKVLNLVQVTYFC